MLKVYTLLFLVLISSCSSKSSVDYQEEAFDYFLEGNYKQALHSINEAIHLDSLNNENFSLRARIYAELADTIHFQEDVNHVLQFDSTDTQRDLHLRQLINWENHVNDPEAQDLISKELELFKNDTNQHLEVVDYVVRQYLRTNDTSHAIQLCETTIKDYPNVAMPYLHLASVELARLDFRHAIKHYRKFIEIDEQNDIVYSNLAYCYIQLGNKNKAKKYYKLSAELGNSEACKQFRELSAKTRYRVQSRCCDGSTSSSTGRGTCSHHGGVCDIEYIPYKEYSWNCN